MSNPAFEFVRQLGQDLASGEFDLPPFPDTAFRVQQCINDPDSDLQKLTAIVAGEPALAARLMRMANSAMMRRSEIEVTDLNTAISRVGTRIVLNAAASFAAREAFKPPPDSLCANDLNELRQHSVRVAAIAYSIAKNTYFQGRPDEAMLAGLLHAVGKFYILMKAADYPDLFSDADALNGLIDQWHAGVARAIVESWQFPEAVALGVDEQDLTEKGRSESADIGDILLIAKPLARDGLQAAAELGDLDALARLGTDAEQLAQMLSENEEQVQSMISALSA